LHGSNWAAGEIAHMNLDLSRASENWKARGYLESIVGSDRILSQLSSTAASPAAAQPSARQFLEHARTQTGRPREFFDEIMQHLGIAVANLICAFDPGLVILQGGIFRAGDDRVREVIASAVPWDTRVVVSDIANDAVLLGAVAAARAQAYERIARLLDESNTATVASEPAFARA
ncbi:MAG: ROK family protein, partial [Acidobacteriota bacterium]